MNFSIFKNLLSLFFIVSSITNSVAQISEQNAAQEKERMVKMDANMKMEDQDGWANKAGIGLDIGQLLNFNPYIGAGSNRIGLGGAISYKANYKKSLLSWKNDILFNISTQRIGNGTISSTSDLKVPFEKALDILNLNSNIAYQINASSPWAYSLDLGFRSQLLSSYIDSVTNKIYLKELNVGPYNTSLVSKLFSPALITLAPGMKYTKEKYYAFLSPVAGQILLITDQAIANLGIHGTKLKEGSTTEYKTSKFALGALAKAGYTNTYWDIVGFNSEVSLYSDYLDNPQNIDVVWMNSLGVELFNKRLILSVKGDFYYDDDKLNSIYDSKAVGGVSGSGKRINIIEQLLLTYTRNF